MTLRAEYDVVVVGSGVAGLTCALRLAGRRRVLLVTSGALRSGSTRWAQGGIAAAVGGDDDPRDHADDTRVAGAGMCDDTALHVLTSGAPQAITRLLADGVRFDTAPDGTAALTREGGHRRRRVLHAGGDATGAEVSRALAAAVATAAVDVCEHATVLDLNLGHGVSGRQVTGVTLRRAGSASPDVVSARAVILATGGVGGVFRASTNPVEVTGDGLALALRAGASLVDLEFVQFHPTGLRVDGIGQVPLISEALRGEGAVLRDRDGAPIMAGHHPLADLAPRDVVARRIDEVGWVGLDATGFGRDGLRERFPTAYRICHDHGIDPATDLIPVAPVQHFLCGGIRTDDDGATDVVGLYAVGECAATGVHGANRLASNSLLEGSVFGARAADALATTLPEPVATESLATPTIAVPESAVPAVRSAMSRYAGVRRSGADLAAAQGMLDGLLHPSADPACTAGAANRWTVAAAILAAANARRESRGCHWRCDFPASSEEWRHRIVVRLDPAGMPVAESELVLGGAA
ncbi:MAG TPA: L-aspartate oxidase [Mycobacteriales bacterium]|nr:L-aspartate oxidase [Mycobacteriales bacterium]